VALNIEGKPLYSLQGSTFLFSNDQYNIILDYPAHDPFARKWQGISGALKVVDVLNESVRMDSFIESRESVENLSRDDLITVIHKLKNRLNKVK